MFYHQRSLSRPAHLSMVPVPASKLRSESMHSSTAYHSVVLSLLQGAHEHEALLHDAFHLSR